MGGDLVHFFSCSTLRETRIGALVKDVRCRISEKNE